MPKETGCGDFALVSPTLMDERQLSKGCSTIPSSGSGRGKVQSSRKDTRQRHKLSEPGGGCLCWETVDSKYAKWGTSDDCDRACAASI